MKKETKDYWFKMLIFFLGGMVVLSGIHLGSYLNDTPEAVEVTHYRQFDIHKDYVLFRRGFINECGDTTYDPKYDGGWDIIKIDTFMIHQWTESAGHLSDPSIHYELDSIPCPVDTVVRVDTVCPEQPRLILNYDETSRTGVIGRPTHTIEDIDTLTRESK